MEFNMLMTVVDSVSKTTHFISAHTIVSVKEVVRLFLQHM